MKRTLVVHIRRGADANGRSRYLCERRGPRAELERRHVELAWLDDLQRKPLGELAALMKRVTCPHCREAFKFSPAASIGEGPDPWKLRAQGAE